MNMIGSDIKMKVLCIGHIAYDITLQMKNFPQENTRNEIINICESGGGSTANSACLLSKWQEEAYICGVVGYDASSEKIKKEFNSFNVKTDFLETDYENQTSLSYIILNPLNASRTIMSRKISLSEIKKNNYTTVAADAILLDGYEYETALKTLKSMPSAISILDAGRVNKQVLDLCSKVNFIICSKEFAEEVTNIKIINGDNKLIAQLYQTLKQKYPKQEIIVTLEDQGALYSYENHIKLLPALKVNVKDTTGAGDIFHGAFAYQYLKTKNIESATKFANIAAGLSTQYIGVKNSYPNLNEVNKYYEQV